MVIDVYFEFFFYLYVFTEDLLWSIWEDSDESDVSGSDGEDRSWISWFCSLRGNELLCEVDESYIQYDFKLCGITWFRFETMDLATRLLIPIILLQNHNRYIIMEKVKNCIIDIGAIENEVKKLVYKGEEAVIVGSHSCIQIDWFTLWCDRFVVIDILAGPCTYGKFETEEGSATQCQYKNPSMFTEYNFPSTFTCCKWAFCCNSHHIDQIWA